MAIARRPKINRRIGTPDQGEIIRIDVYRQDDSGMRFKTSMSLDPATLELALALHGSTAVAEKWLKERAEELWEDDRRIRLEAKSQGREYRGTSSISRDVQREVLETAAARLLRSGTANQAASGPAPKRRRRKADGSALGDRMAGHLVELVLHEDGRLSGQVLTGGHEGRDLRDLALSDLLGLLAEASELDDKTDEALVTAYMDHRHPDWRTSVSEGSDTLREDRDMLGLPPGADTTQVKLAHRRLMLRVHPDHGGTAALSARLNLARDRLMAALSASAPAAE